MSRWTAKCWLGSSVGYQDCEVNANTVVGAEEQLKRIYGAEQIINLHQIDNDGLFSSSKSDSSGDNGSGLFALAVILGGIWVVTTYWNFFVILFWISVGCLILWLIYNIIRFFLK